MSDKLQEAWAKVMGQLSEAGLRIDALTEGREPVERAEGYRFLTRVMSAMIDFSMEAEGQRPAFVRVMTPTRKFYGDCPDTMYHRATLRSGLDYRISGQRGGCIYLAFCVYGLRGKRNAILANVSDAELVFESDGSFEIILSAERPEVAANWLRLEPAAATLVARQYFADWATETPARFNIEPLEPVGPPPAPQPDEMARRLRALGESVSRTLRATEVATAEWIKQPNEISFDSEADGLASLFATPDNQYVGGWYKLAEDEALVMTGRAPKCRYWGIQLWSRWLESREFLYRPVCLNHSQVKLEADGSFRIAVAHRNPGTPNWLDTAGHAEGGVVFRWLLPEDEIERPTFCVEKIV